MSLARIVAELVGRGENDLADELVAQTGPRDGSGPNCPRKDDDVEIENEDEDIADAEIDAELDEATASGMASLVKMVKEQSRKLSAKDPKMVARAAFIATAIGLIIRHGGNSTQGNIIDNAGQKVMTELGVEGTEL